MTLANASTARLNALVRKNASPPAEFPDAADPVAVLVHSFLLWESTTAQAMAAYERLKSRIVDFNDFRVCLPPEMADHIGSRYPRAVERCQRLRSSLNDLYHREHVVSFARAQALGKREVRAYVESLQGITPFVSARLLQISFGVHGVPLDEQRLGVLISAGVLPAGCPLADAVSWINRHVKADEATRVTAALQALADAIAGKAPKPAVRPRSTARAATPAKSAPSREPSKRAASPTSRKPKPTPARPPRPTRSRKTSA